MRIQRHQMASVVRGMDEKRLKYQGLICMIENRTLYADDCLNVLNDPERIPNESVDLIYLDPPPPVQFK